MERSGKGPPTLNCLPMLSSSCTALEPSQIEQEAISISLSQERGGINVSKLRERLS